MIRCLGVAALLLALCGCETLTETYVAESTMIAEGDGVRINEDLMRDMWGGESVQLRIVNGAGVPICAFVDLNEGAQTSGYSFPGTVRVAAGASTILGFITLPAQYSIQYRYWAAQGDGACGAPPPD
jgi:hypothetical protein